MITVCKSFDCYSDGYYVWDVEFQCSKSKVLGWSIVRLSRVIHGSDIYLNEDDFAVDEWSQFENQVSEWLNDDYNRLYLLDEANGRAIY